MSSHHFDYPRADSNAPQRSDADYAAEFRQALEEAVRIRLRADVPVGCYLSGEWLQRREAPYFTAAERAALALTEAAKRLSDRGGSGTRRDQEHDFCFKRNRASVYMPTRVSDCSRNIASLRVEESPRCCRCSLAVSTVSSFVPV